MIGVLTDPPPLARMLTVDDVAEILNTSKDQVYALLKSEPPELVGFQIGGRNQWRVEPARLEEYIQDCYRRTRERRDVEPVSSPRSGPPRAR